MDFGAFLGNDALKRRLQESFRQGKTSHCYLLCGVEGSGRRTLALQMAAALECKNEREPGCGVCPACRKVLAKQHPDVITVDDTEHKNVAVDIVRQARSDVFIRPNEGRKKVYIIPRGQDLGAPSQNALLKILEEPPEYAVFLILTTSAERLLPTIRSRAVQLQLSPLSYEQAIPELKRRFPDKSDLELADALEQTRRLLCMALRARAGSIVPGDTVQALLRGRTGAELLQAAETLQTAADDLSSNVGVGAVVGGLCVQLK